MAKIGSPTKKISEARKTANKKWNEKNLNTKYDHIHLVVPAGTKDRIKAAADAVNESVNEYIGKATEQRMKTEE